MTNREKFILDAKKMWDIGDRGIIVNLKPDLNELSNIVLRIMFRKKNVNYHYLIEHGILKIYIEESRIKKGLGDWIQNFYAKHTQICIDGIDATVHTGFYLTTKTIFNDLNKKGLLEGLSVEVHGYSHGGGCVDLMTLYINLLTPSSIFYSRSYEAPKCFYKPGDKIKELCKNNIRYVQGKDIVPEVPFWMEHVGILRKVPGEGKRIQDHNIYWTKGE